MNQNNINKLITEALAIEAEEAKEAGALGYMARALTQATMPHSKTDENEFVRRNGNFVLTMMSPSRIGLPYGSIPRLLISWMTTEAVKTQEPDLQLGPSLSSFMAQLDMVPTGGRWGSITRLREQTKRLLCCAITAEISDDYRDQGQNFFLADNYDLWWNPKSPEQGALWNSKITLSHTFFEECINNPVPVDLRALKALKKSPLALDIYCWLTYRMSYLRKDTKIPWAALQVQFGAGYPTTKPGRKNFKINFVKQLQKVLVVYPEAKVDRTHGGLQLRPSKTHIPKIPLF